MRTGDPLGDRLGLNIPYEWWPAAELLAELEGAGFGWVQLPAPPVSVLSDTRSCISHARAVAAAIGETGLRAVLHAPGDLMAGAAAADRALAGAISYAAEAGATDVVYHAQMVVDGRSAQDRLLAETRSLAALARTAERVGVGIALENLAPVYPGPETVSANPLAVRALARRLDSPAVGLCVDIGHANVIAGLRRTSLHRMIAPVLDVATLFHVHDNLGARWHRSGGPPGIDPLRLDLHLAPGLGTIDWDEARPLLSAHPAPLILEVHPPRPGPPALAAAAHAALAVGTAPAPALP